MDAWSVSQPQSNVRVKGLGCHDDGALLRIWCLPYGAWRTSKSSTTYSFEVCSSLKEIYITFRLSWGCALGRNWLRPQRWMASMAVLPEDKGKGLGCGAAGLLLLLYGTRFKLADDSRENGWSIGAIPVRVWWWMMSCFVVVDCKAALSGCITSRDVWSRSEYERQRRDRFVYWCC